MFLLLTLSASGIFAQAGVPTIVQAHGQLAVEGTQLVDAQRETIVLRGVSFAWHVWWPKFWNYAPKRWW